MDSITRTRRASNSERLLRRLGDGKWHTSIDLVEASSFKFQARLSELRRDYRIDVEAVRIGPDLWRYQWRDCGRLGAILAQMNGDATPAPVARQLELV